MKNTILKFALSLAISASSLSAFQDKTITNCLMSNITFENGETINIEITDRKKRAVINGTGAENELYNTSYDIKELYMNVVKNNIISEKYDYVKTDENGFDFYSKNGFVFVIKNNTIKVFRNKVNTNFICDVAQ